MNLLLRKILIINITLAILFTTSTLYTWTIFSSRDTFFVFNPIIIYKQGWTWTPEGIAVETGLTPMPNYPFITFLLTIIIDSYYFIQLNNNLKEVKK